MSDLSGPTYMYMDSNHGLYIADSANHRIQYWHSGASFGTTIAGIASTTDIPNQNSIRIF